jgi:hypothetical protein
MKTDELLQKRNDTHGAFTGNARTAQAIKKALVDGDNFNELSDVHREALSMIAHKMARIVNGIPDFDDHWDDIAGYAQLPKKFNHGR